MPPLQLNKVLAALRFQSKGKTMPTGYALVTPAERQRDIELLLPEQRVAIPKLLPAWYRPELPIAPHQLMCDDLGQGWKDLNDVLCDAVVYAHNLWRLQAKFTPVPIAGPVVAGPPGCLTGPPLEPLIKQFPGCAALEPMAIPYRDAVASGVSQAFMQWQTTVTIPGLPLFPSFAMGPPGPAIPAPNIPQKLIACVSANLGMIMVPNVMKELMCAAFDPYYKSDNPNYEDFFDAISTVISLGLVTWLSNQMVMGLVGTGAVASPVGGPVAGVTMPTAGHLAV